MNSHRTRGLHRRPGARRVTRALTPLIRRRTLLPTPVDGVTPACDYDAPVLPSMDLPDGHMPQRPAETAPAAPIPAPVARITRYQARPGGVVLRLGQRVRVAEAEHPAHGALGEIAAFRPDQPTPVGLFLDWDEDREFIVWLPADTLEPLGAPGADTLVMDALEDLPLMGGAR